MTPVIEMNQVRKVFGSGHTEVEALKETNFSAHKGELIAIIGPSGSGKSTFLTICGGLQTPTSGEIRINGENITKLSEKELSRIRLNTIGFILQAANLVPFLSVEKQIELINRVKTNNVEDAVKNKLYQLLDVEKLLKRYPSDLSGGEKQRVAILKALYANPSIILADEPTASLDSDRAFEVMRLLKETTTTQNITTLVVTHDTRLIDYFDKVYEITDGRLTEKTK